jgi:hypothetical protein
MCGRVRSSTLDPTEDIEVQQPHKLRENGVIDSYQMASLRSLFGLPEGQLRRWPGAKAYCQYLEKCFQPLLANEYAFVWSVIGEPRPQIVAQCWPWFNTVSSAIRVTKKDSSVEEIWDSLRSSKSVINAPKPTDLEKAACLVAIFSVLCWGTMTLQPRLNWTDFKASPSLMVQQQHPGQPGLKMDLVRRPIPAIFRNFQRITSTGRWRQPISGIKNEGSTALYASSLNYASLKVIGKIHLVWVDDLSSRLDFDSTNQCLSIFRFPSFCALSTLDDCRAPIFDG